MHPVTLIYSAVKSRVPLTICRIAAVTLIVFSIKISLEILQYAADAKENQGRTKGVFLYSKTLKYTIVFLFQRQFCKYLSKTILN